MYNMSEIKKKCCICGQEFTEYGNNPYPVRNHGECCDMCNIRYVLPARFHIKREIERFAKPGKPYWKEKVYISGAIAGHDVAERKAAFKMAASYLSLKGYEPVNPFENGVPDEAHWREHMRADIALLLGCDYIYMLQGWELSKGAKLELDVASSCGIKVLIQETTTA